MSSNSSEVRLEVWTDDDLPLLRRLNEPAMTLHLGGPETEEQIQRRHRRYVLAATSDTVFVYRVSLADEGLPAGQVTFWERTWRNELVYEMGWGVLPEHQGRGIARRAVTLALAAAAATNRHRHVHAFPAVENVASNALCQKAGFVFVEECDFEYPPGHRMRCNDWRFDLGSI